MSAAIDTLADELLDRLLARDDVLDRLADRIGDRRPSAGYLDVAGAADFLACPKSRIYSLVSAQRLPHHRDGSRLLFDPAELREYVRAGGAVRP